MQKHFASRIGRDFNDCRWVKQLPWEKTRKFCSEIEKQKLEKNDHYKFDSFISDNIHSQRSILNKRQIRSILLSSILFKRHGVIFKFPPKQNMTYNQPVCWLLHQRIAIEQWRTDNLLNINYGFNQRSNGRKVWYEGQDKKRLIFKKRRLWEKIHPLHLGWIWGRGQSEIWGWKMEQRYGINWIKTFKTPKRSSYWDKTSLTQRLTNYISHSTSRSRIRCKKYNSINGNHQRRKVVSRRLERRGKLHFSKFCD
jgi:hypothetical protein